MPPLILLKDFPARRPPQCGREPLRG